MSALPQDRLYEELWVQESGPKRSVFCPSVPRVAKVHFGWLSRDRDKSIHQRVFGVVTPCTYPTVTSKMFDPTEDETAMSPKPFLATITLVIRSGMEVPAAKKVKPITCGRAEESFSIP